MLRPKLFLPILMLAIFCFACNKPSDDTISTSIKAKLYSEPLLKSASVDVAAKDGVVTLSGQVPNDAARLTAEQIASATPGVKTVVDRITLPPPPIMTAENLPPAPKPRAPRPAKPAKSPAAAAPVAADAAPAAVTPASDAASNPGPLHPASTDNIADTRPSMPAPPPPPPPPQPITVTIPDGTIVSVRTIDSIDSSVNHTGELFRASLDSPIVVGDSVVVPKGLNVYLKLIEASSAGKFKGRSELTVSLDSFTFQGKTYQVATSDVQEQGGSRGKRSAAVIGGGAALGALIGGLAGGGKGAAIGAGVGAGSGTAVQALTHGEQVKIPSETRLDFTLHNSVDVTYLPKKPSTRAAQSIPQSNPPADAAQPPSTSNDPPPQQ
jgi:hypothetical protein